MEVRQVLLYLPFLFWGLLLRLASAGGNWLWRQWVNHKRNVIQADWMELEFAPQELRDERESVHAAVKQDWRALEFASEELRGDHEIAKEAVEQCWRALRFVSKEMRADRDLVLGAVRQSNGWALEFAAEELYQDVDLVREATSGLGGRLGLPLSPVRELTNMGSALPMRAAAGEARQDLDVADGAPNEGGVQPSDEVAIADGQSRGENGTEPTPAAQDSSSGSLRGALCRAWQGAATLTVRKRSLAFGVLVAAALAVLLRSRRRRALGSTGSGSWGEHLWPLFQSIKRRAT